MLDAITNRVTTRFQVVARHLQASPQPPPGFTKIEGHVGYHKGSEADGTYEYWSPDKPTHRYPHPKNRGHDFHNDEANQLSLKASLASNEASKISRAHPNHGKLHMEAMMAHREANLAHVGAGITHYTADEGGPKTTQAAIKMHTEQGNAHAQHMAPVDHEEAYQQQRADFLAGGQDGDHEYKARKSALAAEHARTLSQHHEKMKAVPHVDPKHLETHTAQHKRWKQNQKNSEASARFNGSKAHYMQKSLLHNSDGSTRVPGWEPGGYKIHPDTRKAPTYREERVHV